MSVTRRDAVLSTLALTATAMIPDSPMPDLPKSPHGVQPTQSPLVSLGDYEQAARARIPRVAWEYIESGAADEITVGWNKEAYRKIRLLPRQLNDVSHVDTRIRLLSHDLPHPILLAPTAAHILAHPDGEIATARGAKLSGAGMVLSTYTSVAVEKVAAEQPPLFWFQLYVQEKGFTQSLIQRAAAAGVNAICVTIDTPNSGPRNRQERAGT